VEKKMNIEYPTRNFQLRSKKQTEKLCLKKSFDFRLETFDLYTGGAK
jgi:hypothetical protein